MSDTTTSTAIYRGMDRAALDAAYNNHDAVHESAEIRDSLYPPPAKPKPGQKMKKGEKLLPDLSYAYIYKFTPVMERRLSQGGVRLAAYLNALFVQPPISQ